MSSANEYTSQLQVTTASVSLSTNHTKKHHESTQVALIILPDGQCQTFLQIFSSNVVRTKIPLISILFSSLVLIFVLVLVSSTIIQNVFVIFVIVFIVIDGKNWSCGCCSFAWWKVLWCHYSVTRYMSLLRGCAGKNCKFVLKTLDMIGRPVQPTVL